MQDQYFQIITYSLTYNINKFIIEKRMIKVLVIDGQEPL